MRRGSPCFCCRYRRRVDRRGRWAGGGLHSPRGAGFAPATRTLRLQRQLPVSKFSHEGAHQPRTLSRESWKATSAKCSNYFRMSQKRTHTTVRKKHRTQLLVFYTKFRALVLQLYNLFALSRNCHLRVELRSRSPPLNLNMSAPVCARSGFGMKEAPQLCIHATSHE